MQRIRDEAHRFAITTHRKKKIKICLNLHLKKLMVLVLKEKSTIKSFGSAKAIEGASLDDIKSVEGSMKVQQ